MTRHIPARLLVGTLAAFALIAAGCGDDSDGGGDTTAPAVSEPSDETTEATDATTEPTDAAVTFEGELVGTFAIDAAECADAATTTGSYFKMLQAGGTLEAGPFIENNDSPCADKTFSALSPGTDGGLTTGASQPAPDPAFDGTGNGLASAIFEPVTFFAVAFAGATDADEAVPTITATDGTLSGDLSAFTAYYANGEFNQGAPKPDGSGEAPTGTIDPETGEFVLEWSSLIVGGSFDGFTGVWHLEGTFTPAS